MRAFRHDLLDVLFLTPFRKNLPDDPVAFRVEIQILVESEIEEGFG